ncbi:hypothetical protein C942_02698 [Photobacterium marinum]|uniref:Uncharacterized protein n=1 Tax=Photobacterium marinum TaxID=1056511 RepID=L8JEC6_9GAMM|nr:hypothetical protein [Photobacterium marinum]ELR67190.1 hypothetical protein C942_02698 [Photobacterium marinum]
MGKGNFLIFATVIGGVIVYGMGLAEKDKTSNKVNEWDNQIELLWENRSSQINLGDYPNINKKNWCGLYFGNKSTPEQDDFEQYLKKYKSNTLSNTQGLPDADLYGNLDGYKKLSCMEPDNQVFIDKIAYYESKIKSKNNKNIERSKSAWSYRVSTDEMTQEKSIYLSSRVGTTIKPMSFPYTGTESAIYFGCNSKSKWAYFWFSNQPNIRNDQTKSGYSLSKSRISFDDELENITMTQEWGSKFMHVRYPDWLSKKLTGKDIVKLELDWHGEGRAIFSYDVQGFKPLYSDFVKECSTL